MAYSKSTHFNAQSTKSHKITKTLIFLLLAILTIIAITITIPLKHNTTTQSTVLSRPNLENSLKIFCSVTQDPELCFTSISVHLSATAAGAAVSRGPDELFTASLEVAVANITSLTPLARRVLAAGSAAEDHCQRGFSESVSQLNRVKNESQTYQTLTSEEREEAVTWLIRGMSGLEVCVDVLDEMGMAANDLSVKVYKARVQARNSADFLIYRNAILNKLQF